MAKHTVGIIMNGVTGRMGTNQHLIRSLAQICEQGGLSVGANDVIMPELVLVGRNALKLEKLATLPGVRQYSTDLAACLADPANSVYFDAQTTRLRADSLKQAIAAGKHVYCEKPTATDTATALELYRQCRQAGLKNGVVQDKLWLPGLIKLKRLIQNDFFGRILAIRAEFGYWVFEGHSVEAQRPSWNYRQKEQGGIILDLMPHFRYILDNLFGEVEAVSCLGRTHISERIDENGAPYDCDVEDSAYLTLELAGNIVARLNCSWATRVRRDDLLILQVDGVRGSAVAGLRECYTQHYGNTPRPVWNPDIEQPLSFNDQWARVPAQEDYDNAFKAQWILFLRHLVLGEPFSWNLLEGAKGVQLAELATRSWKKRRWVTVPALAV